MDMDGGNAMHDDVSFASKQSGQVSCSACGQHVFEIDNCRALPPQLLISLPLCCCMVMKTVPQLHQHMFLHSLLCTQHAHMHTWIDAHCISPRSISPRNANYSGLCIIIMASPQRFDIIQTRTMHACTKKASPQQRRVAHHSHHAHSPSHHTELSTIIQTERATLDLQHYFIMHVTPSPVLVLPSRSKL